MFNCFSFLTECRYNNQRRVGVFIVDNEVTNAIQHDIKNEPANGGRDGSLYKNIQKQNAAINYHNARFTSYDS